MWIGIDPDQMNRDMQSTLSGDYSWLEDEMNSRKKTLAVLVAAAALSATPLLVASAEPVTDTVPVPARTHGGWVCVNYPIHVCIP